MSAADLELRVHQAIAAVDDPEYPGVSIVDLGLLESISLADAHVDIGLIPTFSGCPALAVIADDVCASVSNVDGIDDATVTWLTSPVWTTDRVSHDARKALGDQFTVSVQLGRSPAACPRCGSETDAQSLFGPSRCRSVHRCPTCHETVEVLRS